MTAHVKSRHTGQPRSTARGPSGRHQPLIVSFKDVDKDDIALVGGKTANLGEMAKANFPVPDGFAITVHAYDKFLQENNIGNQINEVLRAVDVDQPDQLETAATTIKKIVSSGEIPKDLAQEIIKAYKRLSGRFKKALTAVRSSATAEDLPGASFAGQQATFLNVQGEANLLTAVRDCWASLFTARAIFYREENKIAHEKVKISVIVQKMIQSEVSGVMFTIEPVTNEKDRIVIEAVWGLGELVVQGTVTPDKYVVQKETFSILSKEISVQHVQLTKVGSKTKQVEVPKKKKESQKLKNEDIIELAKLGDALQKHYYFPQDIEWVKDNKGKLIIVQTRPVTTVKKKEVAIEQTQDGEFKLAEVPLISGAAASPGIGSGEVKIVRNPKEIARVKNGDVLVAEMTSPDFVPAMKRASAIVTDKGGLTSHAAIVSRELGIPCVVGTQTATEKLKEGMFVTIDGGKGLVFMGSKIKIERRPETAEKKVAAKTATKLYVNLAEPERARQVSKLNVDGVGLLRAEFMIANIGVHPKEAISKKKQGKFIDKLTKDLTTFCKTFDPRPVVYRTTDFKTNEYRQLPGGKTWEPEEPNPMLGFRGAYRYTANPEVFNLELQAMKKVREKYKNLWLMVPYVRTPQELAKVRRIVSAEGLLDETSFKFWMMVELPTNVILIDDFIKVGVDGVSIGSNDLTMLILGTDRDNPDVAEVFDERSPAVLWSLKRVIKACSRANVTSSICGQAPSVYDELVEELVKAGITSISVNPDAVNRVRGVISETENEIAKRS